MDTFCKEKGFIGWFETSAKENINIDESAKFLLAKVSTYIETDTAGAYGVTRSTTQSASSLS